VFIFVCQHCRRRWSSRQLPSPFSLSARHCPVCHSGDLLSLGNIPGVTAPPLVVDEQPLTLPLRIHLPRPTPPPPVLMLTNFSETTEFAQLFGTSVCATLQMTLRDRVDLLFSLPRDVCLILRTCPNPSVTLVQLIDALHPSHMSAPAALDSQEIGACVLLLCQGRGPLPAGSMVTLLHTLACPHKGLFGRQIANLFEALIKKDSTPIAPVECEALLDALLSGGDKLTPSAAGELITFLLKALTPKRAFDIVRMLHANGTGLGGTKIAKLFAKMCAHRLRSEVIGFCDVAEDLLRGSHTISPPEFFELTKLLLKDDELKPGAVEEVYRRLRKELSPGQTRELCLCFLTPVTHPLLPRAFWEMLLLLLDAKVPIGPLFIVELAEWLMHGVSALDPMEFYAMVRALVAHGTPLTPLKLHGFAKHLLTHISEPLNPGEFQILIGGLTNGTAPLTPVKALNLCSGVLQDTDGLTPRGLLTFLGIFSAAGLVNSTDILGLVTHFFNQGMRGRQMLGVCRELSIAGPTGLDIAQTRECLRLLRDNNTGLQPNEVVVLVHGLCGGISPLAPRDFRDFLLYLRGSGSTLPPERVLDLYQWLCTGVGSLNPTGALQLMTAYSGHSSPLPPLEFVALVESLAVGVGLLTPTELSLLLRKLSPGPTGLAPARARALLALLLTGGGALRPNAIYALMDLLFNTLAVPTGIKSVKSAELLEWLINGDGSNGITPQRADGCIVSLLNGGHLTRLNVWELIGVSSITRRRISPAFLYNLSQEVGFPADLAAALVAPHMNMAEVLEIMIMARVANITANQCCSLVKRIPNVGHSNNESRPRRVRQFIEIASAMVPGRCSWANVFSWLADFILYWNIGNSFVNTGEFYSDPLSPEVDLGGGLYISGGRINYFCNAHSFRYCDFSIVERAGDNGDITFFTHTFNRGQIEAEIANFVNTNWAAVNALANEAYNTGTYQAKIIGIVEVGCRRRPGGGRVYITHFVPGGNRIPVPVLKALWKLLRP
jgi:hypothetical protein